MSTPYLGEIRIFAGNFAPVGWAICDGQLFPISGNEALFNLIGTTYGGDGQVAFALPDLRSRVPIHQGQGQGLSNRMIGQPLGTENVTLTPQQLPNHTHTPMGGAVGNKPDPINGFFSSDPGGNNAAYASVPPAPTGTMNANAVSQVGGNQPHNNIQPVLAINYIIALMGVFPPQS